ncbi:hypothetical protein MPTK1_5g02270 [Marchantia polymorpha subsp. ruderalis]|uniref:Uncharacterized protein n=2 Tax=Marchantia polymorpha TaxID=3197 RepID=A0AAF6BE43_MARPO|nr:hypothetical protein MARPO_0147s0020 [Marchantia polymorpha]BBN10277.1 hypothetical protein Mp_5g02270 [Marchantia polymorpha subsp. ruderalis]PTQ29132.1 hypothetical protein MARPO_0147s0020 [Marchantia polymorpha]PTQ29134.1 hypothetical protein MARPO_0147s0020 [Marchantia polymorpha]PTQ29137.1 hypothetical protein MARPO_0147s0020 [Marchantia polymorpha]|eukprot:PTQ29131.1 hypothetical protein MARPO_0147s0020 [Marchantia polymorpha]
MMATASRKPGADNSSSALSSSAQVKIRVGSSYRELACVFTLIFLPVIIFLIHSSSPAPSDPISLQRVEKIEDDPVLPFCEPPLHFLTEHSLLDCAARKARLHERNSRNVASKGKPGPQRLAFCFLSRGHLPHEHLWRRFFHGQEELHSIYVHTHPSFQFPNTSLFYGHQVPSEKVERMSISLVDAMRRLMAYAVLDPEHGSTNSWFIFACEVTIPIRSFSYTYDYLTKSRHSFVESFAPVSRYYSWETLPEFERWRLRKGEVWMALQRRHAAMILGDWSIYFKFRSQCTFGCNPDESYVQTFLDSRVCRF